MVFSHQYLGWRRLSSFRTVHPTEITPFYSHRPVTAIYIPIPTSSKPYPDLVKQQQTTTRLFKHPKITVIPTPTSGDTCDSVTDSFPDTLWSRKAFVIWHRLSNNDVPWHSAPAIWARFLGQGALLWYSVTVATTHARKGSTYGVHRPLAKEQARCG